MWLTSRRATFSSSASLRNWPWSVVKFVEGFQGSWRYDEADNTRRDGELGGPGYQSR